MPTLPSGKLVNVDHIPVIVERLLAEGKTFRLSYVIGQCNLALWSSRRLFPSIPCDAGYRRPKYKNAASCTEANASQRLSIP